MRRNRIGCSQLGHTQSFSSMRQDTVEEALGVRFQRLLELYEVALREVANGPAVTQNVAVCFHGGTTPTAMFGFKRNYLKQLLAWGVH